MGQVWRKRQLDPHCRCPPRGEDGAPLAICPLAGESGADPSRMAAAQSSPVSRLHGWKLEVKCCEYSPFPCEESAPSEPDGLDPSSHTKAPAISRIKLGTISLCYPNMTLDVTHALHLLSVPLPRSPHWKVMENPFPSPKSEV